MVRKLTFVFLNLFLLLSLMANPGTIIKMPEELNTRSPIEIIIYKNSESDEPIYKGVYAPDTSSGEIELQLPESISAEREGLYYEVTIGDEVIVPREPLERPAEPMDDMALQIGNVGGTANVLSNMGISEASPNAPLTIRAASTSDQALYQSWRYTAGSDQYALKLKQTVTSGVVRYTFDMINNSTAYNNVLTLDRGSVGIGTTGPEYKLDINSGDGAVRIGPNSSYGRSILLGGWGAGTSEARVRTSNGNLHMDSRSGNQIYLNHYHNGNVYIASGGGNVGIGTASPSYKLHVVGDIYANGGWVRVSGSQGIYFESYGGGWNMTDGTWIRSYGGKRVYCDSYIRADGGLYVSDDEYFWSDSEDRIATMDDFYVQSSSNNTYLYSANTYLGETSGDYIHLRGNQFDWTSGGGGIINTSGNVGIGTTGPSHRLTVQNTTDDVLRLIGPDSFGYGARLNFGDGDYVYLDEDVDDRLTIYANGRTAIMGGYVGIGTTSPTSKLYVSGDARVTGRFYDSSGDAGVAGDVLTSTGSGTDWVSSSVTVCVNPWQDNVYGTHTGPIGWNYTMGYDFTPSVSGEITALGGFFSGTKTVYLWNDGTGALLASASVTGSGTWAYSTISPVTVNAGTRYCVAVYLGGSGAYYRYNLSMPDTYGDITIQASCYYGGNGRPTNSITTTMYGMADVEFCTEVGSRRRPMHDSYISSEPTVPKEIYSFGSGELIDGSADVVFETEFSDALGENIPTVVTTPISECNGLIISETNSVGFSVREAESGNSNAIFNWIAIAKSSSHENEAPPVPLPHEEIMPEPNSSSKN